MATCCQVPTMKIYVYSSTLSQPPDVGSAAVANKFLRCNFSIQAIIKIFVFLAKSCKISYFLPESQLRQTPRSDSPDLGVYSPARLVQTPGPQATTQQLFGICWGLEIFKLPTMWGPQDNLGGKHNFNFTKVYGSYNNS